MQNLQTERINLFLCLLPWRGFLEGIYLFSSFLSFLYKCLLPLSPSPQLVYSGNKNLTLTLRSLVFQTVQSAESKEKNRCVPHQTSVRVMHKCWELILEMETTEIVLKGEHIPLMDLLWLNPHTPSPPFYILSLSSCPTHPWGQEKTGMHQKCPFQLDGSWTQGTKRLKFQLPPDLPLHLLLCILQGSCQHLQQNVCQKNQQGR